MVKPDGISRHPYNHRYRSKDGWTQTPIDLAEWAVWVHLVESGTTPLLATRMVLEPENSHPRGMLVSRDGVISTDDL